MCLGLMRKLVFRDRSTKTTVFASPGKHLSGRAKTTVSKTPAKGISEDPREDTLSILYYTILYYAILYYTSMIRHIYYIILCYIYIYIYIERERDYTIYIYIYIIV